MKVTIKYTKLAMWFALAISAALPAAAQDIVVTKAGRQTGPFTIEGSKVRIGNKALPWERIAAVLTARRVALTSPNALVMRNGERWRCTIVGLHRNRLRVRVAPYGTVDVDIQLVASMVFNETGEHGGKPGRLYRTRGNPISGKLTGVSAAALSLNSALGVFNLDRKDVARYVLAAVETDDALDELYLINGSLFRGKLTPRAGQLQMEHPILGSASVSAHAIQYLRRQSDRWRQPREWKVTSSDGPMGPPGAASLQSRQTTLALNEPWIEALRIEANTTIRLAPASDRPRSYASIITPASTHGGSLIALAGNQVLSEHAVSGEDAPMEWSFKVPAGQPLDLQFKFDEKPGMPCAVFIGDPLLFWE
jgi:hypothetical protein